MAYIVLWYSKRMIHSFKNIFQISEIDHLICFFMKIIVICSFIQQRLIGHLLCASPMLSIKDKNKK